MTCRATPGPDDREVTPIVVFQFALKDPTTEEKLNKEYEDT